MDRVRKAHDQMISKIRELILWEGRDEEAEIGYSHLPMALWPPARRYFTPNDLKIEPFRAVVPAGAQKIYLERLVEPNIFNHSSRSIRELPKCLKKMTKRIQPPMIMSDARWKNWEFAWDLIQWKRDYNIAEIEIQDFGDFLDFPPWSRRPDAGYLILHNQHLKPIDQPEILNSSTIREVVEISDRRLERLTGAIARLNYYSLILKDYRTTHRRKTVFLLYLLRLTKGKVYHLKLDTIRAGKPISLVDNIDLENLESLIIYQSKEDPAWKEESIQPVLMKWLRTPEKQKQCASFFFNNVKAKIGDLVEFIKTWHLTREPQLFGKIIFDEGTWCLYEVVLNLEKNSSWGGHIFHPDGDVHLTFERTIPPKKRKIIIPHKWSPAVILYSWKDGQFEFSCFPSMNKLKQYLLDIPAWDQYFRAGGELGGTGPPLAKDVVVMKRKHRQEWTSVFPTIRAFLTGST